MRAVVQRVGATRVAVGDRTVGAIRNGLLVYLGVAGDDGDGDARWIADKLTGLRVFADADGAMNRSIVDVGGSVLCVSQFTLLGDARKGRRPSFTAAARPERALPLFDTVCGMLRSTGLTVETGEFGTHMTVYTAVDGPVTILIDSRRIF